MHGRRVPACNVVRVAAQDVLLSPCLPPGERLWNSYLCNNSIGFDNSRCIWKPVVYRSAILYPLSLTGLMLKPRYYSYPGLAVATHKQPLRRFMRQIQILSSVEVWGNILTYTLDLSWVKNTHLANLPCIHQCMPPVSRTVCIKFHLQIMA